MLLRIYSMCSFGPLYFPFNFAVETLENAKFELELQMDLYFYR